MNNVEVYLGHAVIGDGKLLEKVLNVKPPTRDSRASIEIEITGDLTYKPGKYTPPPKPAMPKDYTQDYWTLVTRLKHSTRLVDDVKIMLLDGLDQGL